MLFCIMPSLSAQLHTQFFNIENRFALLAMRVYYDAIVLSVSPSQEILVSQSLDSFPDSVYLQLNLILFLPEFI